MITIRPQQTLDALKKIPGEVFQDAKKVFQKGVFDAQDTMKKRLDSVLNVRTGQLRRSMRTYVKGNDIDNLEAGIYFTSKYAPIQEFGGTIKGKKAYKRVPGGPYLNIPTKFNQTASGVMRNTALAVFGQGGKIVKVYGKYKVFLKGRPMFTLVKSVDIPARMGFLETAQKQYKEMIKELEKLI